MAVADLPDGVLELAGAVKHLYAEVHRIDHQQVRPAQSQLGWEIEFPIALAGFADGLEDVALHVEHEDLVAKSVRYINSLFHRVYGNSGGPFEISFAAFQAADGSQVFSAWLEDKNLARVRIGYIDIVLGIDGDALRRCHRVFALFLALDELVLALREIEDVHTGGSRIGHNDASARIGGNSIGAHEETVIGSARHDVN